MGEAIATNRFGNPYNTDDLLTWVATGGRTRTHNVNQRFGYSIYRDASAINKLKDNFNNFIKQQDPSVKNVNDVNEIVNKYREFQERKRIGLQNLYEKMKGFTGIPYKRIYGNPKNPQEEIKKIDLTDVVRFATNNLRFKTDRNVEILIGKLNKKPKDLIMLADDLRFYDQFLQDLRKRGYTGRTFNDLRKKLVAVYSEYTGKSLFTEDEIKERNLEDQETEQ